MKLVIESVILHVFRCIESGSELEYNVLDRIYMQKISGMTFLFADIW
jgi:hypothetical protein